MKLAIFGATGRMGLAIGRLSRVPGIELVGACAAPTDPSLGRDFGELLGLGSIGIQVTADPPSALLGAEVMIDFSTAAAAAELFLSAARQKVAIVSGTTNLDAGGLRALDKAAASVPVLWAPNMSLGVQVLAEVVEQAIRRLGPSYDVEIVEAHHRKKIDAPSGTAKRLIEAARAARPELTELSGRSGDVGARKSDELAVLSLRGGDVVGDHSVFLLGDGERLELVHRATNRDVFAHGAIRAAHFLVGKPPGRYSIKDVLSAPPPRSTTNGHG